MDLGLGLCKPSTAILLIGIAGAIYHLLAGNMSAVLSWAVVGIFGTGIFQALCFGGLEPVAWVLMSIPVLIVCFFLAVALFASRMRIENILEVPCDRCGHKHHRHEPCNPDHRPDHKPDCKPDRRPRCNKTRCDACNGCGCPHCLLGDNSGSVSA